MDSAITCYEHARIFTGQSAPADCFAVQNGCFLFAGSTETAHRLFPRAGRIDLGGRFVCPGFNDSHMHLLELGCVLTQAQLAPCSDALSHVLHSFGSFAAAHPDEPWVLGRGWNHDFFADGARFPTRDDLDAVCPDRPALITRACGHIAVANSCALRLCGIADTAPQVGGGRVDTDESGRPTGVLRENAIFLVTSRIPTPDRAGIKRRLSLAMDCVRRYGITSVQTDDFSALSVPFEEVIGAYLELKAEGRLTVRVTEQCYLPTPNALHAFLSAGYHTGWGDELFRIGPLKLITDGSLGARTAFLRAPYSDAPDTHGIATYRQEELNALVLEAHRAGMQIAAHAIGDGAADLVLNAFEQAQSALPRADARHGIVHAQVLTRGQALRMKALRLHAYIQPIFLDYDTQIVGSRLGERALDAYPAASLLEQGITLSSGSDSPVEPPDVLAGIQCAVTRMPYIRRADAPYLPQEALSLADALRSFTSFGAYASFEEREKGVIAPGYRADFTVLTADPFAADAMRIHSISVAETYLAGKRIFKNENPM